MATILLVDADAAARAALSKTLRGHGHVVRGHATASTALREARDGEHDAIVLDLGLRDLDGESMLRMLRTCTQAPVIITTAHDDETTLVRLLNSGADDYVVKPFSGERLTARISAVLRRSALGTEPIVVTVGELRIDLPQRRAVLGGRELELSGREFDLLSYLACRAGVVVSRQELIESVWRQPRQPRPGHHRTVDVHVSWLRGKLGESGAEPRYLHTVRGVGLKLMAPARAATAS